MCSTSTTKSCRKNDQHQTHHCDNRCINDDDMAMMDFEWERLQEERKIQERAQSHHCHEKKKRKSSNRVHWNSNYDDRTLSVTVVGPLLTPASEMSVEDQSRIWFQPYEVKSQKQTARNVAMMIRQREPPCDPMNGDPSGYANVISRVFASCCSSHEAPIPTGTGPTPLDMELLIYWNGGGGGNDSSSRNATAALLSRRGIERWSIPQLGRLRKQCRVHVIDAVLDAQDTREYLRNFNKGKGEEMLRKQSEHKSHAAKLFARVMGKADEMVVRQQREDMLTAAAAAAATGIVDKTEDFQPPKQQFHRHNHSTNSISPNTVIDDRGAHCCL